MSEERLLFVDDEASIRITLPMILEQHGFKVTVAATVAEALECITRESFDVLLADLNIGQPGDGFTVISAMRRTHPEAATFILTGYPDFETALQALRDQVDDYITKPADIKQLVQNIRTKIAHPQHRLPFAAKRVSSVLRENSEKIMAEWLKAASAEPEIARVPMSRAERMDHLPEVLAELADRVEAGRFQAGPQAREAARKHGRQRQERGYRAHCLVAEARLLHQMISRTLQEHLLSIDLSTIISDLMQIGESLNEELEESVQAFEEAPARKSA